MGRLIAWLMEEFRLMRAESWEREDMAVKPRTEFMPCSNEDPRCQETIRRLAECRERMRRMKSGILDGRPVNGDYFANTDTAATIHKARTVSYGPVRAVPARRSAR